MGLPLRRSTLMPQYRPGAKFLESSSTERELGALLDALCLHKTKGILGCLSRGMSSRPGRAIGECLCDHIWSSASTLELPGKGKEQLLGVSPAEAHKMARAWSPWCKRGGWGSWACSALRWDYLESGGWWVMCRLTAVRKFGVGVEKPELTPIRGVQWKDERQ